MISWLNPRFRKNIRWLVVLGAVAGLASCGTVKFYTQAVGGQAQIWWCSKPIPKVLAKPDTQPKLRQRLELVQELRTFAKDKLHLPADESFHQYADLGRDYVVWVVFAAPEFSTEGKAWWYPIVGSLKYRGYFSDAPAKKEALALKKQGYDVVVGGVEAYSTLGWFADPVLNTFLHRDAPELAELIFHELTHIRLFIPGDTDFNEALATAVGQEGARRWLRSRGRNTELARYNDSLAKDNEIITMLRTKRDELAKLYEKNRTLPVEAQREAKQKAISAITSDYQRIRQRWQGDSRYDKFFKTKMNNARLSNLSTYNDLVPAFEHLLAKCGGDLEKFFAKVAAMKDLSPKQRRQRLEASE